MIFEGVFRETEWPIVFQTAEGLLICALELNIKTNPILLKIRKSRRTLEVSRAATESAILFQPRPSCASSLSGVEASSVTAVIANTSTQLSGGGLLSPPNGFRP
jgi:hypothetical protein